MHYSYQFKIWEFRNELDKVPCSTMPAVELKWKNDRNLWESPSSLVGRNWTDNIASHDVKAPLISFFEKP